MRERVIGYPVSTNDQRQRSSKSRPSNRKTSARSLVAARDGGRRNFARGTDAALRSGALGAVIIQHAAMARSLCASRHGTLADFLRSVGRREQGLGKERSRSCRLHFTKEFRS